MNTKNNISAIILAAGNSERMNFHKAFLRFDNKTTFLEKIIDEYLNFGVNEIVVVLNNNSCKRLNFNEFNKQKKCKLIINPAPELGRFYSLKLALNEINTEFCFVQNVDNPFVNENILEKLFINRNADACTVPVFETKGGHPIIINNHIKSEILKSPNHLILNEFLKNYQNRKIEVDDKSVLININTKQDYSIINGMK
ncbi:MAG: NTP transferase domain-containing protein [Bacteroidetes bacterium]|jgi:CTP:molybdopterin cytidylyltransferase MocA|nr:NTP transferase domain-containing protein [Bacteroidota bacterium]MBT6685716.1 NTP transferase domain-containing protein [Bacteroidota bacterium]MBT7143511.1 NTP transferase domain-containing protein [Bacteroidota bacterium]MBT7492236.1 NTP transferase domain-containing protein [Bacteroidota bacterium]